MGKSLPFIGTQRVIIIDQCENKNIINNIIIRCNKYNIINNIIIIIYNK